MRFDGEEEIIFRPFKDYITESFCETGAFFQFEKKYILCKFLNILSDK